MVEYLEKKQKNVSKTPFDSARERRLLLTTKDIKSLPAIRCIAVNVCSLVLSKLCPISWCRRVAVGINCTFQRSFSKRRQRTRWREWGLRMSPRLKRHPASLAAPGRSQRIRRNTARDLCERRTVTNEMDFLRFKYEKKLNWKKLNSHRRTIEKRPKWTASSSGQTYLTAFPRWFRLSQRQRGIPFQRQSWDTSYRTRDSTRCSMCCRDYLSCWTPRLRTQSFSSYLELNNLPRRAERRENIETIWVWMSRQSATFISLATLCAQMKSAKRFGLIKLNLHLSVAATIATSRNLIFDNSLMSLTQHATM